MILGVALSPTDTVIAIITGSLAFVSAVANYWLGYRRGIPGLRSWHYATSVLSAFYVVGYVWLLTTADSVDVWSSRMRGLSLLVWVTVWIAPAVLSVRIWHRMQRDVLEQVAERVDCEVRSP